MKGKGLLSAAASLLAAVILSISAGANLTVVSSPAPRLSTDGNAWIIVISDDKEKDYTELMSKIEVTATLTGDTEKYKKDIADGTAGDFQGMIGVGALFDGSDNMYWYQFGFSGLTETSGGDKAVAVKSLGSNKYKFTATFGNVKVHKKNDDVTLNFKEWGSQTNDYTLTVNEMLVYGPDGNVVITADASGNLKFSGQPAGAEQTAEATTAAPETEETTTTTEETTTASSEEETDTETSVTEAETSETTTTTTTKAQETSAQEETKSADESVSGTTAAQASEQQTTQEAKKPSNKEFGSRDSTLLIVGIVAGVVIVGIIIALIVVMTKKKK